MQEFNLKTHIYMDKDGLAEVLAGKERVFIVTDRFMEESGMVGYLTGPLKQRNIAYQIFSEVKPDPDLATITKGIGAMQEFKPQVLLALGGGSPIDAAKAMNWLAAKEGWMERCTFVAIPTTSGTGSEVSKFSVVSDPDHAAKYPLVSAELLPDVAILDAELVKSLPPHITADTGIDVLTHAIEAFVSVNANDFTDAAAEKAIKLVRSNLLKVFQDPGDIRARQSMHHASCLAGMAFSNAGLGLNHGMAHTLGAHFHISHGRANGILLPYVMEFNAGCHDGLTVTAARYAQIARLLGLDGPSVRQSALRLLRNVKQYVKQLQIPESIAAAGVPRRDFDEVLDAMTEAACEDACTRTNPRPCQKEDIRAVFLRAYSGKMEGMTHV